MAKHLFIDGFNVIRRDTRLKQLERTDFYQAQERLNRLLAQYRRGTVHRITVVYDGTRGPNTFRSRKRLEGVEIVYSAQGETADEVIEDLVGRLAGERDGAMVVTADRGLQAICRGLGVPTQAPEDLLRRLHAPPARPALDAVFGKREERGWEGHTRKTGNPRRKPKAKRRPRALW